MTMSVNGNQQARFVRRHRLLGFLALLPCGHRRGEVEAEHGEAACISGVNLVLDLWIAGETGALDRVLGLA